MKIAREHVATNTIIQRFNRWFAEKVTEGVGTMWCAYLFALLALMGLPAALSPGGAGIVSWIAQTFLQLVLLSVIIVGQNIQSTAADARAAKTFEDTEKALDLLNTETEGGLNTVLAAIRETAPAAPPAGRKANPPKPRSQA